MQEQFTCYTCGVIYTPRRRNRSSVRAYCSRACYHGNPGRHLASAEDRFWSKVDKSGPIPSHTPELGPCWLWTAATNRAGYGIFGFQGRSRLAHDVSYVLDHGHEPPPETPFILHHCDNKPCVRPSHFYAGTKADNSRDAVARGRTATGDRSTSRLHPEVLVRGEQARSAKLTEVQVREIRRLWAEGNITQVALGDMYGVAGQSINMIVRGLAWAHVK